MLRFSPSLWTFAVTTIITLLNLYGREVGCEPQPALPFQVFWNAKTEKCSVDFGIQIEDELRSFGIVVNPGGDGWTGDNTTLFSKSQLGYYPYIDDDGTVVHGGVPQAVNLTAHLHKVRADIESRIPSADFVGLAIIDWEPWRPMWDRDWDTKRVYQNLSEKLVQEAHPDWKPGKIAQVAKEEYETAAREMMEQTLQAARSLRPDGQWGYYLFPHCYSHSGERKCPQEDRKWNDKIAWMFKASNSLFPSAYFSVDYNTSLARNLVFGEVGEARRVRGDDRGQQIYLYSRITYREGNHDLYYTNDDIYNSIGMAAMVGASGIVLWDDNIPAKNSSTCETLKGFIHSLLGPGVKTASQFATMCSQDLCNGHGRCVLPTSATAAAEARRLVDHLKTLPHDSTEGATSPGKDTESPSILKMLWRKLENPSSPFQMTRSKRNSWPREPSRDKALRFQSEMERFIRENENDAGCDCYEGYSGFHCENPKYAQIVQEP